VSVTITVTGAPTDGVMITLDEYGPAAIPVTFTENVRVEFPPDASLSLVGLTVNQG